MTKSNVGDLFAQLVAVMAQLRGPNGCPWDKEQTPQSSVHYIIEEAHETIDAIETGDAKAVQEELGDLLMQVVFQAQMVSDTSAEFTIANVVNGITQKLIVRHPHVFGDVNVKDSTEVLANWEKSKVAEKKDRPSILSGLPKALPALLMAFRMGEKTSRLGFDWPDTRGILDKVNEEVAELQEAQAQSDERVEEEFGDLLFTLANLGRHLKVDPETALRKANAKFRQRFQHMEAAAKTQGRALDTLSANEWEKLWAAAKA